MGMAKNCWKFQTVAIIIIYKWYIMPHIGLIELRGRHGNKYSYNGWGARHVYLHDVSELGQLRREGWILCCWDRKECMHPWGKRVRLSPVPGIQKCRIERHQFLHKRFSKWAIKGVMPCRIFKGTKILSGTKYTLMDKKGNVQKKEKCTVLPGSQWHRQNSLCTLEEKVRSLEQFPASPAVIFRSPAGRRARHRGRQWSHVPVYSFDFRFLHYSFPVLLQHWPLQAEYQNCWIHHYQV